MDDKVVDYFPELLKSYQALKGGAEALALLDRAAREHTADPRPLVLLAAELVHAKRLDQAEAAYLIALQRAPGFDIARFQLGLLLVTSGRPAAGLATWAPLDRLEEKDPLKLFKRGLEALVADSFDAARALLLEGIAANTINPALNRDMEKVLARIAELQAQSSGSVEPPTNGPASPKDAHVLLSAYQPGR